MIIPIRPIRISKHSIVPTKRWTPLQNHPVQIKAYQSKKRFNVVPAGRRCLAEDTLVATPFGPIKIQDLKVGDFIIGYDDGPQLTQVTEIHNNGIQKVNSLINANELYLEATDSHKLLSCHESNFNYQKREVSDLNERYRVKKSYCFDLISGGDKSVKYTYALGALLGDGCSRENKSTGGKKQKNIYISSPDKKIPQRIANLLNCDYSKNHKNNYTYKIKYGKGCLDVIPFYKKWCHNRYSYQKIAPFKEINKWDKKSCLAFLAGIIDTDGSVFRKSKNDIALNISMQSKSIINSCYNIIFKYFQEKPKLYIDDRKKYKNGKMYCLVVSSNFVVKTIIEKLKKYLVNDYDITNLNIRQKLPDRIGFKKGKRISKQTYDITVANKTNLYILHHGAIVSSNSGKTEIIGKRKMVLRFMLCHDKRYPHFYSPFPDPKFFIGAPTRDQVKRIYWADIKSLIPVNFMAKPPNESNLVVYGRNGAELHLMGLDKPERIEGSPWDWGVVDEIGNVKKGAWQENIRPALSDRKGGCDFIGVPEGRNHYYDMWLKAKSDKTGDWGAFHWISADILDPQEIAQAKADMDELVYLQEYEASFINFTGRAYYNFSNQFNTGRFKKFYNYKKPISFHFDFNVAPGVAVIAQEMGADVFQIPPGKTVTVCIGEVYIPKNSTTPRVCQKLIQDWKNHKGKVICYGDSTGGAKGSAKVRGSDWDIIKQELMPHFGDRLYFNVPKANPQERQRVNAVNSRLKSVTGEVKLLIDEQECPYLVKDLEGVVVIEGGAGEIDKKSDITLTHISDALGYYIHREFPVFKYWSADDINQAMKTA